MFKRIAIATVLVMTSKLVFADDVARAQDLMKSSDCAACHSVDKKILGPSFLDIAAKYKGDGSAVQKLSKKIIAGGAGVWGPIPMPAHPQLASKDAEVLASWILAGAPKN